VGLLQVSSAGVLWGTGGLVVTVLHEREGLGAMTASAWRMALAAVALIALVAVRRRLPAALELVRRQPGAVLLVGCGTALYQGLYFVAVLLVGVSVSTVVALGLAPVLASAWEHRAGGTRPSPRELAVLTAAVTGLALVSATAGHGSSAPVDRPTLGLLLAIAAGAAYAATTVLGHRVAQRTDPVTLTTCATTVGAVALAPFLGVAALGGAPVVASTPSGLALLAYLGIATMALSYGLLYAGLRTTSGSAATVATLVEPLAAAFLAALLLGERVSWVSLVGGALILAAVVALRPVEERRERPGRARCRTPASR
jgi:DME family drug/metabolite transporter